MKGDLLVRLPPATIFFVVEFIQGLLIKSMPQEFKNAGIVILTYRRREYYLYEMLRQKGIKARSQNIIQVFVLKCGIPMLIGFPHVFERRGDW